MFDLNDIPSPKNPTVLPILENRKSIKNGSFQIIPSISGFLPTMIDNPVKIVCGKQICEAYPADKKYWFQHHLHNFSDNELQLCAGLNFVKVLSGFFNKHRKSVKKWSFARAMFCEKLAHIICILVGYQSQFLSFLRLLLSRFHFCTWAVKWAKFDGINQTNAIFSD